MKNEFSKAEWDAMKNFPKISLHLQKTPFSFQKITFYLVKDGLLHPKRLPFVNQYVTF